MKRPALPWLVRSILILTWATVSAGCQREPDISVKIQDLTAGSLLESHFATGLEIGFLDSTTHDDSESFDAYAWVSLSEFDAQTDRVTVVRPGESSTAPHPYYWVAARTPTQDILGMGYLPLAFSNTESNMATVVILDWCGRMDAHGNVCASELIDQRTICAPSGANLSCLVSECGDGVVDRPAGELCDPTAEDTPAGSCLSDCTLSPSLCGDGEVTGEEECDDANDSNFDDCTTDCRINICGDGFVNLTQAQEECDDGNTNTDDDCLNTCVLNQCGDGFVKHQSFPNSYNGTLPLPALEACDDQNDNANDGCHECALQFWTPERLFADETQANEAPFAHISDLAFDLSGNMYVTDALLNQVYIVSAPVNGSFENSTVTLFAGSRFGRNVGAPYGTGSGYSPYAYRGDGDLARFAELASPRRTVVDGLGIAYIFEAENNAGAPDSEYSGMQWIRRVDGSGFIETVVTRDDLWRDAQSGNNPRILDIDLDGEGRLYLLVSDPSGLGVYPTVYRLDPENPQALEPLYVMAESGSAPRPDRITVGEGGQLFLASRSSGQLFLSHFATGSTAVAIPILGGPPCTGPDCTLVLGQSGLSVDLDGMSGIDFAPDGTLRVALRWLGNTAKAGVLSFETTAADQWFVSDATSLDWQYEGDFAIRTAPNGNLYSTDDTNRAINQTQWGNTNLAISSTEESLCLEGRSDVLPLQSPRQILFDPTGNSYVLDQWGSQIHKIRRNTRMRYEFIGTGAPCYFDDFFECGDNPQEGLIGFGFVDSMALDGDQYLYVADAGNKRIRKIELGESDSWASICDSRNNRLSSETIVGNGETCQLADCLSSQSGETASLDTPRSVTTDAAGNLYFIDQQNVYRMFAESDGSGISGTSTIELLVGCADNSPSCSTWSTNPLNVRLEGVEKIVVAPNGDLWLTETVGYRIRRLRANAGMLSALGANLQVVAGTGLECGPETCAEEGDGLSTNLGRPGAILPLLDGTVLFSQLVRNPNQGHQLQLSVIRRLVAHNGRWDIENYAGRASLEINGDIGDFAELGEAVFVDIADMQEMPSHNGTQFHWVVLDSYLNLVRGFDPGVGMVSLAGAIRWHGDCSSHDLDCTPSFARPKAIHEVRDATNKAYWVVDAQAGRVRQYQPREDGTFALHTVVGYPALSSLQCDGDCESPESLSQQAAMFFRTFVDPSGLVQDHRTGAIYIAEEQRDIFPGSSHYGGTIHCVDEPFHGPMISFFAGSADGSGYRDGTPLDSQFRNPSGLAVHWLDDATGHLYIADSGNHVVRRIRLDPTAPCVAYEGAWVETIAGTPQVKAYLDDDGELATDAYLNNPQAISLDNFGNLFISDTANNRVRRVDYATQEISTVLGQFNVLGGAVEGASAALQDVVSPRALLFDGFGNLLVTSSSSIKIVSAGVDNQVSGHDSVFTIFPRPVSAADNEAARGILEQQNEHCLSAMALDSKQLAHDTLHILDGCNGNWLTLTREATPTP